MILDSIAISDFSDFSKIDRDLNRSNSNLEPFLKWNRGLDSFEDIIHRRETFPVDRKILQEVLLDQYACLLPSEISNTLIQSLEASNVFTVCTAHQPSLFAGPAFIISKAISTIKLAQTINQRYPSYKIVPVFVIGSEDHDVEELNHCYIHGQKIQWNTTQKGPVGRYTLEDIHSTIEEVKPLLISTRFGPELIDLLEKAYQEQHTFAQAFQYILHTILGPLGILILNTDDKRLKERFKPYMLDEILHSSSKSLIQHTQQALKTQGYEEASHARDINFFYFDDGFRERIEKEGGFYKVINRPTQFDEAEIITEIDQHPERFSPNVILRPIYQEILLPNLAYIGGGGELAYWLERKAQFEGIGVAYPMLVRRDSFMMIDSEQFGQLKKYKLSIGDLALRTDILLNQVAESLSPHPLDLTVELNGIQEWLERIRLKALDIDSTLGPSVEAEKTKLVKSIEHIEKKLLKSEKNRLEVQLNKVKKLKDKLVPDNTLMERHENFMTFYSKHGQAWIDTLLHDFNPLDFKFKLIQVED